MINVMWPTLGISGVLFSFTNLDDTRRRLATVFYLSTRPSVTAASSPAAWPMQRRRNRPSCLPGILSAELIALKRNAPALRSCGDPQPGRYATLLTHCATCLSSLDRLSTRPLTQLSSELRAADGISQNGSLNALSGPHGRSREPSIQDDGRRYRGCPRRRREPLSEPPG